MSHTEATKEYYEGTVEAVYRAVSGSILHLGIFQGDEPRQVATHRTKQFLAARLPTLRPTSLIVDLGSGYGDAARFLASRVDGHLLGLNLIHSQNRHARSLNREAALHRRITIIEGDFARVPLSARCANVVWSQEAFLHAPDRSAVLRECARLLAPGGRLIFTDILQTAPMRVSEARLIYERVKIDSLDSFDSYQRLIQEAGLQLHEIADLSQHVAPSYKDHIAGLERHRGALVEAIGSDFVDYTVQAMTRWVRAAEEGKLGWGMFVAQAL